MSTALYRRYRPEVFQDVIGQDHVVDALENALDASRTAHAYLFSGPRGCGKTTSARILARSLNCAEGPTSTPCGVCDSCKDLAIDGDGSLDVIEIDAASHSSVEDARALRERATFAPARDRYRIFILDEAHMVTAHGFNALLKVVEEPPEHVKFIFATTEPDKVLNTIRSRTHHYPFRLVPPAVMVPFLKGIVAQEGIEVEDGVYPLVVRAGGGSVRDSLSVLDQLMAGVDKVVTTADAVNLLGYTDAALLEQVVDAIGQQDGAAAFAVINQVMDVGSEPRRFVEDLLQRFRDLLICVYAQDQVADILPDVPQDQLEVMKTQAELWGAQKLSAAAVLIEETLRSMGDTTSPGLQLELMLARLLVENSEGTGSLTTPVEVPRAQVEVPRAQVEVQSAPAPTPAEVVPEMSEAGEAPPQENVVSQRAPQSGAPPVGEPSMGAPSTEQVREVWAKLREYVGQYSSLFGPVLQGSTKSVYPDGGDVVFGLASEQAVNQLLDLRGDTHLAAGLTQIFGRAVGARIVVADSQDVAPERTTADERPVEGAVPAAEVPAAEISGEEVSGPDISGDEVAAENPAAEDPAAENPSGANSAGQVPEGEAPVEDVPVEEAEQEAVAATEPVSTVPWRGRPAVDVVLDVLGGQIIEERILGEEE